MANNCKHYSLYKHPALTDIIYREMTHRNTNCWYKLFKWCTFVESPVKPEMAVYIGSLVKHFANYYKCRPEKLCFTLPHPAIHHTLNSYSGKRGWYKLRNVSRPTKISHTNSRNMITWHMQHYNQICVISASCIYLRVCQKPY